MLRRWNGTIVYARRAPRCPIYCALVLRELLICLDLSDSKSRHIEYYQGLTFLKSRFMDVCGCWSRSRAARTPYICPRPSRSHVQLLELHSHWHNIDSKFVGWHTLSTSSQTPHPAQCRVKARAGQRILTHFQAPKPMIRASFRER